MNTNINYIINTWNLSLIKNIDFKKTNIYKDAEAVEFVNRNGEEIDSDYQSLIDMEVIAINESRKQGGLLEATVIPENEIYYL